MAEFEDKNNDTERIIADLKRAENNLEQLQKRIQEYERIEEEIMCLRKNLDEESIKSNFEKDQIPQIRS